MNTFLVMHLVSLFSYSPHILLVVVAVIPQMVETNYDFDMFGKGSKLGSYRVTYAMCQVCKCKLLDTYIIGTMREVQLFQFPSAPNCYNFFYCLLFLELKDFTFKLHNLQIFSHISSTIFFKNFVKRFSTSGRSPRRQK